MCHAVIKCVIKENPTSCLDEIVAYYQGLLSLVCDV
jgi:hypothetical protein